MKTNFLATVRFIEMTLLFFKNKLIPDINLVELKIKRRSKKPRRSGITKNPKREEINKKLIKWLFSFIRNIILFRVTRLLKTDNELNII
jgi:hypothetical protein